MSYTINHDNEQEKIYVRLGQHALERFVERFPDIAEKIGFNKEWKGYSWDEHKQTNMFLLYELFKRSKENHTVKNNTGYLIELCERHGVNDTGAFKIFTNGPIIFIGELEKNPNENSSRLILKTVISTDFKIPRYIPESDLKEINYHQDKNDNYRLVSLNHRDYLEQVSIIYDNPKYKKAKECFQCERLDYFYEQAIKKSKTYKNTQPIEIPDEIQNKVNNPESNSIKEDYEKAEKERKKVQSVMDIVQSKLGEIGLKYVCTLDNGVSLLHATDDYSGAHKYRNKLVTMFQKNLINLLKQPLEEYKNFTPKEVDQLFRFKDVNALDEDAKNQIYLTLLLNANPQVNSTFLTVKELREIIKYTVSDETKNEFKINTKTMSTNPLNSFQHYLLKTDMGLKAFMGNGLMVHDMRENYVVSPFKKTSNHALGLCKNKLTDEFTIAKFPYFEKKHHKSKTLSYCSIPMDNTEYMKAIQDFIAYFDNLKQEQKNETNFGYQNMNKAGVDTQHIYQDKLDNKEIYEFIIKELNKYKVFNDSLSDIIKTYNLPVEEKDGKFEITIPKIIKHDVLGDKKIELDQVENIFIKSTNTSSIKHKLR